MSLLNRFGSLPPGVSWIVGSASPGDGVACPVAAPTKPRTSFLLILLRALGAWAA